MRLLLIAAVLMTAAASPARSPCRYGPSYWCSSVDRALSCNAFTHCLQTVWEPQLIDVVQTEVCVASQEQVDMARRVRSVDGQIQEALVFSLCNAADEESMKQQCQTTVSTFLPQVFSLLESKMEASSVAALLGLCRQYDDDVIEEAEYTADSEPSECQSCQTFVTDVRELLNSPDAQEEVVTAVENVCSKFGDLEIWCKAVVDVTVPRLLKYLEENKEVATLCEQSPFCQHTEQVKLKRRHWAAVLTPLLSHIQMDTDSEVICHDCEKVLTSVQTFDKDSNIRTSIEHTLAQLCSLTSLNEKKCRQLWDEFSRVAEDLVKSAFFDVDVPYVCRAMVGCSSSEDEDSAASLTEPPENLMAPPAPLVPVAESQPAQSPYCTECVAMFEAVSQTLQADFAVEQAMSHAKQSLCTQVGILESQCNGLVDVFLPIMLEWLTTRGSSRLLCSQLSVCPEPKDLKGVDFVKLFDTTWQHNMLAEVGSFECDECQILVEDARAADRNPDVQKAIVDFFNEICDKLGQEASQCKALVEQYAPQLFEIIASELEPTVVCELLLHCTKPQQQQTIIDEPVPQIPAESVVIDEEPQSDPEYLSESHVMKKKKAKKALEKEGDEKGLECTVCKLMMERLDNFIAANSTEEKLRGLLEEACALVPPDLTAVCGQFVDTYTPSILHFLLQQLQPLLICDELQLCSTSLSHLAQHPAAAAAVEEEIMEDMMMEIPIEEKELPGGEAVQCDLCQQVVKSVDTVLAHNKTEASVQKALDEVCEVIPEELQQSQCLHLVDQYASVLVELLLQERQPAQACIFLTLCPQSDREVEKGVTVALPEVKATPAPVRADDSNASHHRKQTRSSESDGEGCLLCQTVVNYVQEGLGDPATLTEVEKLLDKACSLLPDNPTKTCDTIVEQFTPLIFKLLQDKVNPLQICQELKLCSPGAHEGRMQLEALRAHEERVEQKPLGEEACTYGPSFWCASMDNARKCGMVQECVEKYGMEP